MPRRRVTIPTANGRLDRSAHGASPFAGFSDPIALNMAFEKLTTNLNGINSLRRDWLREAIDPRRDIDDECGFPKTSNMNALLWQDRYERNPIAKRVVDFMPKEVFKVQPLVYETEDSEAPTAFEEAWDNLSSGLRGEESFYLEEEGNLVNHYFLKGDILSRIGRFGGIFLHLDDGLDPSMPVKGVHEENTKPAKLSKDEKDEEGKPAVEYLRGKPVTENNRLLPYRLTVNAQETANRGLLGLRAFSESQLQVVQWESNPSSPRYCQPVMYLVHFADPNDSWTGSGVAIASKHVHWTRFVHLADTHHMACSNEWIAKPAMLPVLNNLLSLEKLYGGSAEGYWKMCMAILAAETHPQMGGDVDVDEDAMRDMFENMMNGLQRYGVFKGMSLKSVAPTVIDPTPFIDAQIQAICITNGWPIRIFMGSERGELSSAQDTGEHDDRTKERAVNYDTPRVMVPIIDRLIAVGALPKPSKKNLNPKTDEEGMPVDDEELLAGDGRPPLPSEEERREMKRPFPKPSLNRGHRQHRTILYNAAGDPVAEFKGKVPQSAFGAKMTKDGKYESADIGAMVTQTKAGYCIEWPEFSEGDALKAAQVFTARMQGLAAYAGQDPPSAFIPPKDMLVKEMDFTDEEAEEMLEAAAMEQEQKMEDQMLQQEDAIDRGLAPDPELDQEAKLEAAKKGVPDPNAGGFPPKPGGGGGFGGPPKPGGGFPPKKPNPFTKNEEWTDDGVVLNASEFFASCERDERGWCTSSGAGGAIAKAVERVSQFGRDPSGDRAMAAEVVEEVSKMSKADVFKALKAGGIEGVRESDSKGSMLDRLERRLTAAVRSRERAAV